VAGFVETYRGMVYPWQCDHQGHMTTMHYVGIFDQAGWHLLAAVGLGAETLARDGRGYVDVRHVIDYLAEQHVASLLAVESGLLRVGSSSLTCFHRMRNVVTGAVAATCEMTTVHFDLAARVKLPIPGDVRERLRPYLVDKDG
jgi:acyl-CoA thioester hydrolase